MKRIRTVHVPAEASKNVADFCFHNQLKVKFDHSDKLDFSLKMSSTAANRLASQVAGLQLENTVPSGKSGPRKRSIYTNVEQGKSLFDWLQQNNMKFNQRPSDKSNYAYRFDVSTRVANKIAESNMQVAVKEYAA